MYEGWLYMEMTKDMKDNPKKYYDVFKRAGYGYDFDNFVSRLNNYRQYERRVIAVDMVDSDAWYYWGSLKYHSRRPQDKELKLIVKNKIGGKIL